MSIRLIEPDRCKTVYTIPHSLQFVANTVYKARIIFRLFWGFYLGFYLTRSDAAVWNKGWVCSMKFVARGI